MVDDIPQSRDMSPQTEVSGVWLGAFADLDRVSRRLPEARDCYQKVLEMDPRHQVALGFMGIVYHLMGDLDKAIVKYHEVSQAAFLNLLKFKLCGIRR